MHALPQIVKISAEVLAQEIGEETVLLGMNSESYFGLDEVGTRIWQLMQEQSNLQIDYQYSTRRVCYRSTTIRKRCSGLYNPTCRGRTGNITLLT